MSLAETSGTNKTSTRMPRPCMVLDQHKRRTGLRLPRSLHEKHHRGRMAVVAEVTKPPRAARNHKRRSVLRESTPPTAPDVAGPSRRANRPDDIRSQEQYEIGWHSGSCSPKGASGLPGWLAPEITNPHDDHIGAGVVRMPLDEGGVAP